MNWIDSFQIGILVLLGIVQCYEFIIVYLIHNNQKEFKKEGKKDKWLS
jgi:hypothetical protein